METIAEIFGWLIKALFVLLCIGVVLSLLPYAVMITTLFAPFVLYFLGYFDDWSGTATLGAMCGIWVIGIGLAAWLKEVLEVETL